MGILHKLPYRTVGYAMGLAMHACNSLAMFVAMRGDVTKDPDIMFLKDNQFKYITIWNVIFQMLFLSMAVVCDVSLMMNGPGEHRALGLLRSYSRIFFGGVVWPCSTTIFVIFWPMYIYDRELLFPAYIDKVLSQLSNHVMHTSILPIAVWALIFQPDNKPRHQFWYKFHLVTVFVTYIGFLLYNHRVTGSWPYPIMNMIYGTPYFPVFFVIILIFYIYLYCIQWRVVEFIKDRCPKLKTV
ncbi:androgen-dependent TFPI-regulating protein-like [Danaus plexippus]|uniref:androgen-dependent TFPI-regulating protein-like n=1 Tax=Danaus plexippus TaxID=13037 RepID=UPI002AAF9384|nr:androgen-dependent TFPI-regulating protein-like [Danaus plexippus]